MKVLEILSIIFIAVIISILSALALFGVLGVASGVGTGTVVTAFLLIIIVTVSTNLIFYIGFKRYMKEKMQRNIMLTLTEDEQTVVREIMDRGDEVKQKTLGRQLDFSNSKLSALLNNLKKKNVITKRRHRRTNIINLSEDFKAEWS